MTLDATLRATYPSGGIAAACAALPGVSRATIYHRARRLGLSRRPRWTRGDLARLRAQWDVESIGAIARGLGRTVLTVYWKARQLGLQTGAPEGWEYITTAAKRCGYNVAQLRQILRFAGVKIRRSQSRGLPGAGHRFHVIECGDAEDAVSLWMATETVQAAARRHGMAAETLERRLKAAGVALRTVPPPYGHASRRTRLHRRVESEAVDRAVAQWRAGVETLAAAAARHGVCTQTMAGWLRAAGMRPAGYHWLALRPADVDAVVRGRRFARKTLGRPI